MKLFKNRSARDKYAKDEYSASNFIPYSCHWNRHTIITKKELELKINNKEKFYLIDVRTPKETEVCSIETSKKIPLSELEEALRLEENKFLQTYEYFDIW